VNTEKLKDVMLEDLDGDLKEVADLIGVENAMKLVEVYGGSRLYIPVPAAVLVPSVHRRISEMYFIENKSLDEIRIETGKAESTIRTVLFKNGDCRQTPLFEKLPVS
jgi:hypothetical protein